jgi:hypothetical protein
MSTTDSSLAYSGRVILRSFHCLHHNRREKDLDDSLTTRYSAEQVANLERELNEALITAGACLSEHEKDTLSVYEQDKKIAAILEENSRFDIRFSVAHMCSKAETERIRVISYQCGGHNNQWESDIILPDPSLYSERQIMDLKTELRTAVDSAEANVEEIESGKWTPERRNREAIQIVSEQSRFDIELRENHMCRIARTQANFGDMIGGERPLTPMITVEDVDEVDMGQSEVGVAGEDHDSWTLSRVGTTRPSSRASSVCSTDESLTPEQREKRRQAKALESLLSMMRKGAVRRARSRSASSRSD